MLRIVSLRLLLAISTYLNLRVHKIDFETTFVHGYLEETINIEQPKMVEDDLYPNYVCKLHKPLYGLKQSPRQWHSKLQSSCQMPTLLLTKVISKEDKNIIHHLRSICGFPIAGAFEKKIPQVIKDLQRHFPVKHLVPLEYFLEYMYSKFGA